MRIGGIAPLDRNQTIFQPGCQLSGAARTDSEIAIVAANFAHWCDHGGRAAGEGFNQPA